MYRFARVTSLVLTIVSVLLCRQPDRAIPMVVSASWLSQHMNDPGLVILHVASTRRDYLTAHIPGARFLWVGWFAVSNPDLSFEVPSVTQLDTTVEFLGISNDSRVVLYFGSGVNPSPTARMYWTFDYLGMGNRTAMLDGGLDAWKASGNPVTTEIPNYARRTFTPNVRKELYADAQYVSQNLHKSEVAILDSRTKNFYEGSGGGMPRAGHIPGASNIPFNTLIDSTNRFKDLTALKELFSKENVKPDKKVVTYCHIGQQASLLYFVARYLGYEGCLYDGSFEDWSGRMEFAVEVPEKK